MEPELAKALATNGPWALVAGFLLFVVIRAWSSDRTVLIDILKELRPTLESLAKAVERLGDRLDRMEDKHRQ